MDKIEFKTSSGMLEIDIQGRIQMANKANYVSIRLTANDIESLIKFLQTRTIK